MEKKRLAELLANASGEFFRRGSLIFHPDIARKSRAFWILRQGSVRVGSLDQFGVRTGAMPLLSSGAAFPLEPLLGSSEVPWSYTAEEDCYLWQIEEESLETWLQEPPFLRWLAGSFLQQCQTMQQSVNELVRSRQFSDQALAMPAKTIGAATVVCVPATATIAEVAGAMQERRIGSVVVGSVERTEGIVTSTDLVNRAVARRLSYDTPVTEIMTPDPSTVEDSITVLGAGIEMARQKHRHLLLKNQEGFLAGIVSERDIFRAQQEGITHVFRPIDSARSPEELVGVAGRAREFSERVFRQGMEVGQFMRLSSSINDRLARRLLELLAARHGLDDGFCWLSFGSEGREEQGFVTDQDNGIIFHLPAGEDVAERRQRFLAMAREANEALHACGFLLCKGNIMAGNPELCLSIGEWKAKFSSWIRSTTPTAILNSTIFFDFRPVYGQEELADELREHLFREVKGNTIFLYFLAMNALTVAPPLGKLSRFATENGSIDLKTQGSRLFVDIARIYALASGIKATNTEERLRLVGQRIKRPVSAIEGDMAAFRHIQATRLHRQLDSLRDGGDANRVNPFALDELQQRILRESLRQAASLQDRLRLDYKR